jgi:hypothetical protein
VKTLQNSGEEERSLRVFGGAGATWFSSMSRPAKFGLRGDSEQ